MLCKLEEVLGLGGSLEQEQKAGWRKGKKHIGPREDCLQKPCMWGGGEELGMFKQLEHQIGEFGRFMHSAVVGEKPGPSWGKGQSPLSESMRNQRGACIHSVCTERRCVHTVRTTDRVTLTHAHTFKTFP